MNVGPEPDPLYAVLRKYWGYDDFRPLQERVIRSILAGRDVAVVMPTGGGKSLCYQLPAVVTERMAVVISPLIALMQDQAAQLEEMGIPAAFLNSSLPPTEQWRVIRRACEGGYRLLYLAPERLAREDTMGWLSQAPVGFFAIDEAHCISEWGHEFRPEYRRLGCLRDNFPDLPIAAFTASATRRVRHDIIAQLRLREPHKYIRSFHRPNLRYLVRQCDAKAQRRLLIAALRRHEGENAIVYSPTVARVGETVALLESKGIAAVPYHGQMDAEERRANQERWMSDEVPVLVGTIAFGLGINKPAVRAVIHLSMPKSVEQYYQEAGRAGRDGLESDCLLLWQRRDTGLLAHFIEEIGDEDERRRSWYRYRDIRDYVQGEDCRHARICRHFGETPKFANCGMCDVCSGVPEWLQAREEEEPAAVRSRVKSRAARTEETPSGSLDHDLYERLRKWRRERSAALGVAAFVVMHDASLADLARRKPRSISELLAVHGFGVTKVQRFGREVLELIDAFERAG